MFLAPPVNTRPVRKVPQQKGDQKMGRMDYGVVLLVTSTTFDYGNAAITVINVLTRLLGGNTA